MNGTSDIACTGGIGSSGRRLLVLLLLLTCLTLMWSSVALAVAPIAGWSRYDATPTATGFQFTGAWTAAPLSNPTDSYTIGSWKGASRRSTVSTTEKVSFQFRGPGFTWIAAKSNSRGIATMTVDGGPGVAYDLAAPFTQSQAAIVTIQGLDANAVHKIDIMATGRRAPSNPTTWGVLIDIDAVDLPSGARFVQYGVTHAIVANSGPNGSISPAGTTNVQDGSNQTYSVTPDSRYYVKDVTVDGVSVGKVSTYTFNDVTTAHTISVIFTDNPGYDSPASSWWSTGLLVLLAFFMVLGFRKVTA